MRPQEVKRAGRQNLILFQSDQSEPDTRSGEARPQTHLLSFQPSNFEHQSDSNLNSAFILSLFQSTSPERARLGGEGGAVHSGNSAFISGQYRLHKHATHQLPAEPAALSEEN